MIAGYHHKLSADLTQDVEKTREEVVRCKPTITRSLSAKAMLWRRKSTARLSSNCRVLGLRREVIEAHNLRINVPTFTRELLLDQKLVTGAWTAASAAPIRTTTGLRSDERRHSLTPRRSTTTCVPN